MANERPGNAIRFEWRASGSDRTAARQSADVSERSASGGKVARALGSGEQRPGPPSRFRRAWWWGCYLAAWCVVIGLGLVAALRIFDHDGAIVLIWLNAFSRYVYLPAYACLAWAVWQRRWGLGLAAAGVVAWHVTLMVPDFVRDRRFDRPAKAAAASAAPIHNSPTVRVFFANVAADNQQHEALLEEIAAADPDLVVLVEFSWPWHIAFKTSPVMAAYPYGTGWLPSHIGSVNVFSKLPLENEMQNWVTGRAVHTVDIRLGPERLRLIGLHAPRPIGPPLNDYFGYWATMMPLVTSETGPVLIVGDFNATEHSQIYGALTAGRLRSAHEDRGRGWAVTWPNGKFPLPPIRIDQALLSPEVECLRISEGKGKGSDHKPLILDVQIRDAGFGGTSAASN